MLRIAQLCSLLLLTTTANAVVFDSDNFKLEIDDTGQVITLANTADDKNYSPAGQSSPLIQVMQDGRFVPSHKATWNASNKQLTLTYSEVTLILQVEEKNTHLTFEIIKVTPENTIDRIQWGPVATNIKTTVGEVIGVVRDETFAIGLFGLNPKTLGGPVDNSEARDSSRSRSAMPASFGSTLQAYSIDRTRPRVADVWGGHFKDMPVPPIPGESLLGSKIAFFGVAEPDALKRIGEIELAEGLPHPIHDSTWSRINADLGRSYLIAGFTEENVDEMIGYAKRGNFLSLYHPNPFASWGHYEVRKDQFPNGNTGMKACVEKATAAGILMGGHTLTNFINTNDAYVTPIPDSRLAKTGSSTLVGKISANTTEIEIASPEFFNNTKANWLRTVMIGEELVRYGSVSEIAPWKLLDCRRGAWKTKAAEHKKGAKVGKLMDHPYKVFLSNYDMQHDIAMNLADVFNATGMNHLDFDGHEGCHASGQGDFALEMFAKDVFDNTNHFLHNGTSNSQPYYWHINTCCNWGEPWYGGFRSSMADYRINNQAMLERNFMPKMLGWFQLTPNTTLADIEWLMARSAGYNSGFAMSTDIRSVQKNTNSGQLLDTIRNWGNLRMAGAFTDTQREDMRDTSKEFHLADAGNGRFDLTQFTQSNIFEYKHYVRQPGEPTYAEWTYKHSAKKQPLTFTLELDGEGGGVDNVVLEFDNYIRVEIPFPVKTGETFLYDGTQTLRLYDEKGRQSKIFKLSKPVPEITKGIHDIIVTCNFDGKTPPTLQVRFKSLGPPERVTLN